VPDRHRAPNPRGLDQLGQGLASWFWWGQAGEVEPDILCTWQAVWSPPQLQQWGGEVGQHDGTGLLFPLLGQVGFWHL